MTTPSAASDSAILTPAMFGVSESTLLSLTSALGRILAAFLVERGGRELADLWLSMPEERYALSRVFSGEVRYDLVLDVAHHRVGLDALARYSDLAKDEVVRRAFWAYTVLAYTGVGYTVEQAEEEIEFVCDSWSSVLDMLEAANLCAYHYAGLTVDELEALMVVELLTDSTHCYRLGCVYCESKSCDCVDCMERRPVADHDDMCWCRRCAARRYAGLTFETDDEPTIEPRQRSRRDFLRSERVTRADFADEREAPGFVRDDECPNGCIACDCPQLGDY